MKERDQFDLNHKHVIVLPRYVISFLFRLAWTIGFIVLIIHMTDGLITRDLVNYEREQIQQAVPSLNAN